MKSDYIVKKLYTSFVIVSILSALAATLGMLIDNIVVGHFFGQNGIGAMGIVGPMALIFSAIGNISSGGGTARAAQAIGRGDTGRLQEIFSVSIYFVLVTGGILTVVGLIFTEPIAVMLGAKGDLLQPSVDYLRGYFIGAIPTMLTTALTGFIKIDGSPRLPMIAIVVMSVVNICLDLMMVMVFKMGMFGMALATTIAYFCAVGVTLLHFRKKDATLKLVRPKALAKDTAAMTATGAPTALSRICDTIQVTVLNNMLGAMIGVGAVAAMNVRTQAGSFFGAFILGLAQASVPIVGMFYGEEDRHALTDTLKATFSRGLLINCIAGAVLFFIAPLFTDMIGATSPDVAPMATTAVRIFALGMPLNLICSVMISFYQGTQNTGMAAFVCVLERLALVLAFSAMLMPTMGSNGVWLSFLFADVVTIVVIVLCTALRNHRFPTKIADFVRTKEGFGGDPHDRLDLSIGNDMNEVMQISQGIHKFGNGRDLDVRTLEILSLCIEEMAGNVVQHAFQPGEKRWLDVRILDQGDRIRIHMRDNGAPFEPLDYLKKSGKENPDHYGIKMISGLADSMEYRRTMGMLNNLYIVIGKHHS